MEKRKLTSILIEPDLNYNKYVAKNFSRQAGSRQTGFGEKLASEIESIVKKPRVDILSDQPASKDALGIETLVRTLSDIVLSKRTETPITIGIDGQWGTGKTSILKMIEVQARMLDFSCIWLNAWSLESAGNLFVAAASEIQRELKLSEKDYKKNRSNIEIFNWLRQSIAYSGDVLLSLVGGPNLEFSKTINERDQDLSDITTMATSHRSFASLVDALFTKEDERLVVFIDDIDRALPDQIATILKNLKLILETKGCIFILAMDMDIVARSIEDYYRSRSQNISSAINVFGSLAGGMQVVTGGDQTGIHVENMRNNQEPAGIPAGFGYDFLEKMVQLRVEVPSLTRQTIDSYLDEVGIAPEVKTIIKWAPDNEILNPRRLKSYINWLSISLQLINSLHIPEAIDNLTMLEALALRRDNPSIYNWLLNHKNVKGIKIDPKVFNYLENYGIFEGNITRFLLRSSVKSKEFPRFLSRDIRENHSGVWSDFKYGSRHDTIDGIDNAELHLINFLQNYHPDLLQREVFLFLSNLEQSHILLQGLVSDHVELLVASDYLIKNRKPSDKHEIFLFANYLQNVNYKMINDIEDYIRKTPMLNVGRKHYN